MSPSIRATYRYRAMMSHPSRGLTCVVDLTWDPRDRGGRWLVVERGHGRDDEGYDVWTDTGRLVATARTLVGARRRAGRARTYLRRHGIIAPRVDVIARVDVTMTRSGRPYGCSTAAVTA